MPLDPDKKIKSATERIEKMLADYNATCKRHAGNLKSVNLQLKQLDALANSVDNGLAKLLKDLQGSRATIDQVLGTIDDIQSSLSKAKDAEMVQRKLVDGERTWDDLRDTFAEKLKAYERDKSNKQAQKEYEIAEKAFLKIDKDFQILSNEAEELLPQMRTDWMERMSGELPKAVAEYEKLLERLLQSMDCNLREKQERIKRYVN